MPQVLPGLDEYLSRGIKDLGDTISLFMETDRKTVRGIRDMLIQKPELMQQFADMEASSPGMLKKMGFGNLADTLSKMPESASAIIARLGKGDIVEGGLAKGKAEAGKSKLSVESLDNIKNMPQDIKDDLLRTIVGARSPEAISAEKRTERVASATEPSVIRRAGEAARPELRSDLQAIAIDVVDRTGKTNPNDLAKIMSVPEDAAAFSAYMTAYANEKQQKAAENVAGIRATTSGNEVSETSRFNNATKIQQATGRGDPDKIMEIQRDPTAARITYQELQTKISQLQPEQQLEQDEQAFIDSYEAIGDMRQMENLDRYGQISGNVGRITMQMNTHFKTIPIKDRKNAAGFYVSELNKNLLAAQKLGARPLIAKYGPVPRSFARDIPQLHFTDTNGKIYTPEQAAVDMQVDIQTGGFKNRSNEIPSDTTGTNTPPKDTLTTLAQQAADKMATDSVFAGKVMATVADWLNVKNQKDLPKKIDDMAKNGDQVMLQAILDEMGKRSKRNK